MGRLLGNNAVMEALVARWHRLAVAKWRERRQWLYGQCRSLSRVGGTPVSDVCGKIADGEMWAAASCQTCWSVTKPPCIKVCEKDAAVVI